ncbi:GDP-mannose 4,6-dehydratase [Marinospirillum perlucidum]|uniref:GDP-mannose 4,6-dehydratase n=1 Tax=Marinospirillum perlucidum TaxID=1982602 RepID=UPI000DF1E56A|nr:GDP-mannose 4,6-dehydratase [Marinospirillum perlucidum]
MKILVTGGSGFIGSAFVHFLMQKTKHQVLNLDKLTSTANPLSLQAFQYTQRYRLIKTDLSDQDPIQQALSQFQPDRVIHLAAHQPSRPTSRQSYEDQQRITLNLLDSCHQYWQELPLQQQQDFRCLQMSYDQVFGNNFLTTQALNENSEIAPESLYSASKAAMDELARTYHRQTGFPCLLANASNIYGPRQLLDAPLPQLLIRCLTNQPIQLKPGSEHKKSWLFVEDLAAALFLLATQGRPGESYHLSSQCHHSTREAVTLLCRLLDEIQPAETSYLNQIEFDEATLDAQEAIYLFDPQKFAQEFQWLPDTSLETGMRTTLNWYLDHPQWVEYLLSKEHFSSRKKKKEIKGV